jgi:hypothetical protein
MKNTQGELKKEKDCLLVDFRNEILLPSKFVAEQLPLIDQAAADLRAWKPRNLAGMADEDIPARFHVLLTEGERLCANAGTLRQAQADAKKISGDALFGGRTTRDATRYTAIVNEFKNKFYLARGCAGGIRRIIMQLDMALRNFEEAKGWDKELNGDRARAEAVLFIAPEKKPASVKVDANFDPMADE